MVERVVVTGGAGFVGSHLCEALLDTGREVLCVDNFVTGRPRNVEPLLQRDGFTLVRADVSEEIPVEGPVSAVFHLASPASPPEYLRLPLETLRVGSAGTLRALELARGKNARFVLASTSETYGDPLVHPQPETYWGNVNPVGPRSVYDEAKRFGEAATMAHRRTHGTNTAIVRIFNTFGPRMRPDDGRAIPTFISKALAGEPIPVSGDGRQTRSLCFVDDLVDALLRVLESDIEGPVNLGNPQEITMIGLAEWIRELTGSTSEIVFTPAMENDPKVRRPDIRLARRALGWEPRSAVEDGLKRTIEWFGTEGIPE
ncbi:UDP-glucuronic acid decarboxylase family protein [Streptomyces anulatus]|uniref:UDP-glucuronic acid decarboxylase family protein n=1 Tax=Streptomyces anulatus TaxID=1892 RepID=UPI0033CB52CD